MQDGTKDNGLDATSKKWFKRDTKELLLISRHVDYCFGSCRIRYLSVLFQMTVFMFAISPKLILYFGINCVFLLLRIRLLSEDSINECNKLEASHSIIFVIYHIKTRNVFSWTSQWKLMEGSIDFLSFFICLDISSSSFFFPRSAISEKMEQVKSSHNGDVCPCLNKPYLLCSNQLPMVCNTMLWAIKGWKRASGSFSPIQGNWNKNIKKYLTIL